MLTIDIKDTQGKNVSNVNLKEEVFDVKGKKSILYEVVKMQLNNSRQGNACTKTRAEVNKSGRKPWKQKGTGRARAGSAGSPVWRGGGIVFGPRPRDYSYNLNRKTAKLAIRLAISEKFRSGDFIAIEDVEMNEPKTKSFSKILKDLKLDNNKLLLVLPETNNNLFRSARNLSNIYKIIPANALNVYDLLNNDKILITKNALNKVQEVLS